MTEQAVLWPGQRPGVHDHKPYDECPEDCPGRLAKDAAVTYRQRRSACPHDILTAYLARSPYRTERIWLPLCRLARRYAHRRGACSL